MAVSKVFLYFDKLELFNKTKVSKNSTNTSYIENGVVSNGTPDVLWTQICFINDVHKIWTVGEFYDFYTYGKAFDKLDIEDTKTNIEKSRSDSSIEDIKKLHFLPNGKGLIYDGVVYKNTPYWIELVDSLPEMQEDDTLYMIKDNIEE